jgi:hypothetical protein
MKSIAEEAVRRGCVSAVSEVSNWIDSLFKDVDVEKLVREVLEGLE